MIDRNDIYHIGQMGKPHGTRGEMGFTFTDDAFTAMDEPYLICYMDGIPVPFYVEEYRFRTDTRAIVKLEGIDTAEAARAFTNAEVYFPLKHATPTDDDELRYDMLEGYTLTDDKAGTIGTIDAVDDTTINLLFVVRRPDGTELLVPAHEDLIVAIDTDKRNIHMQLPEGLL